MKAFLFVASLFLSAQCFAGETVTCKIVAGDSEESSIFHDLNGGRLSLDLANGNAEANSLKGDSAVSLVSDQLVSTFAAPRSSCKPLNANVEKTSNGGLSKFRISLEECVVKNPSAPTYSASVSLTIGYNVKTNRGRYQELFYDGNTKSPGFFLENCTLN